MAKRKKQNLRSERLPERKNASVLIFIMVIVLALVLLISPFLRGLFFPREILVSNIVIFSLLVLWGLERIRRNDGRLLNSPMEICLLVLLIAYFISFFFAAHKRDALTEVMKIASYLVVYLVALDIGRYFHWPRSGRSNNGEDNDSDRDQATGVPKGIFLLLHLVVFSALALALASLGVAAGLWYIEATYTGGRLSSPIGYPNTTAAFIMTAYFLSIALVPVAREKWKVLYAAAAAVLLMTVVLTFSRGAWLLLPPLGLLLIIISTAEERMRSFLYLAATAISAVPLALIADRVFQSSRPAMGLLVLLAVMVLSALLTVAAELFLKQQRRLRLILGGSAAAVLVALSAFLIMIPLLSPMNLGRSLDETGQVEKMEQVISDVVPGEHYNISFEVNAAAHPETGSGEEEIWALRILGGKPDYSYEELYYHSGKATGGWKADDLSFRLNSDANRLVVQLLALSPGDTAFRQVELSGPGGERNLNFTYYRLLPERFYNRIFSFSAEVNAGRRLELYGDAVKIIKENPLIGLGGRGWAAVYRAYQDQYYNSSTVHNHYLEVWIESGLFGFLAFIGLWVSLFTAFYLNCRRKEVQKVERNVWTAVVIAIAALGVHSAIDWNFTFAAVGICLMVLFAAGMSLDRIDWFKRDNKLADRSPGGGLLTGLPAIIAGLFLAVYASVLLAGLYATWKSQELAGSGNVKQALVEMERGIRLDPLRADNYHNLNLLLETQAVRTRNQADFEKMLFLAERACELEPYKVYYLTRYGSLLLNYNVNAERGLELIDRSTEVSRYEKNTYMFSAISRLNLAEKHLGESNYSEAERYLRQIFDFQILMAERFGDSSDMNFVVGRAYYLLGEKDKAASFYRMVGEDDQYYDLAVQYLKNITEASSRR